MPKKDSTKSIRSIYDLARRTGYSTSTISRVLNQRGRISDRTRQKVLAAAREAGFKPRMSARQTAVGVVLDRLRFASYGGFVSTLLNDLIVEFAKHDVAVEIYTEHNMHRLGSRFVDGVVAMSWDQRTVNQLKSLIDVPVVVTNRLELPMFSAVASDHRQAGRLVGEYLLKHGHPRVAFLAEEADWGANERLEGLREALQEGGSGVEAGLVSFTEHQPLYGALRSLLAQKPDALFLAGEDLALEASFVLADVLKVSVPDELSIVGIDNRKVSQFTHPPLTAIRQPLEEIARHALKLLLELIHSDRRDPQQVLLPNTLIERESVKL